MFCPACGYDLRGHGGDVVTCPECGSQIDRLVLSDLMAQQEAEIVGIRQMQIPAFMLTFASAIGLPLLIVIFDEGLASHTQVFGGVIGAMVWAGFFHSFFRSWRRIKDMRTRIASMIVAITKVIRLIASIAVVVLPALFCFQLLQQEWWNALMMTVGIATAVTLIVLSRQVRQEMVGRLRRTHFMSAIVNGDQLNYYRLKPVGFKP